MTPLAESTEADDTFGPFLFQGHDLMEHLVAMGSEVERLVPHCVGVGLTLLGEGPTFLLAGRGDPVASTLSLPVVDGRRRVAEFELYASTVEAFHGLHEQLALVLGAWAGGAVTDTDLAFTTRNLARRTPFLLRRSTNLAVAVSLIDAVHGQGRDDAEDRLERAAAQAALPLARIVDVVLDLLL